VPSGHTHSNPNTYGNGKPDADSHCNINTYGDSHSYGNGYTYGNSNSYSDTDGSRFSDTYANLRTRRVRRNSDRRQYRARHDGHRQSRG
jgi:hypothetical protein